MLHAAGSSMQTSPPGLNRFGHVFPAAAVRSCQAFLFHRKGFPMKQKGPENLIFSQTFGIFTAGNGT